MEECVVATDLRFIESLNIQIILIATVLATALKDWKHACYCVTLFLFYSFAYQFHCDFKALDPERVLRYFIWTGIDLVFLSALYALVKLKFVRLKQLIACFCLEFIAILMHLIRMTEIQLNGGIITDYFYGDVIMLTNIGFVLTAVLPILTDALKKGK